MAPSIGAIVRPVGGSIRYRVVEATARGCRVEAIDTEVETSPGRKPRPLRYDEKRASLAVSSTDGTLFDDRWHAWEVL